MGHGISIDPGLSSRLVSHRPEKKGKTYESERLGYCICPSALPQQVGGSESCKVNIRHILLT